MKNIEVNLIGDGTPDNPYRPDLLRKYLKYIDETRTLANIDFEGKKVKVYFMKDIEVRNEAE